ncbi:MAG: RAMP superfamily CRISPR-associated protein [Candidatus Aminicenantes bacterium]|jgi:CRISPR/Cas system CSM-associated protein Csm3 (group 7 of RAMP superfamily)
MSNEKPITNGIIIIKGTLELQSPALIGSGRSEESDMDVILDADSKLFIPATSLVGVLKSRLNPGDPKPKAWDLFWGYTEDKEEDKGCKSALTCNDCNCISSGETALRDGIKIDNKSGMVIDRHKYDYQVIEPGTRFTINMEVRVNNQALDSHREQTDYSAYFHNLTREIVAVLKSGDLRIGSKTANGLGKAKMVKERAWKFDLNKKADIKKWFKCLKDGTLEGDEDLEGVEKLEDLESTSIDKNVFIIDAQFTLGSSFIIRSYSNEPGMPDSVTLKSGNAPIISGSSLKGAIRSRCEKILNTLIGKEVTKTTAGEKNGATENKTDELLNHMFGYVNEETGAKKKGKFLVEEVNLAGYGYSEEKQTRIKIDRFTGGAMKGALFDSMPLFSSASPGKNFNVKFYLNNFEEKEEKEENIKEKNKAAAGLLLLVLKDLWTGDLPVGGEKSIGRGTLKGQQADIKWYENGKVIPASINGTGIKETEKLEELVTSLQEYVSGGQ